MTEEAFRRIALSLPEVVESMHVGHPDFRVRGRIFATLRWPGRGWGMVKLTPAQQERLVRREPDVFVAVKGAWGRRGSTNVRLRAARTTTVRHAILAAWHNPVPKRPTR